MKAFADGGFGRAAGNEEKLHRAIKRPTGKRRLQEISLQCQLKEKRVSDFSTFTPNQAGQVAADESKYKAPQVKTEVSGQESESEIFVMAQRRIELLMWLMNLELRLPPYQDKLPACD